MTYSSRVSGRNTWVIAEQLPRTAVCCTAVESAAGPNTLRAPVQKTGGGEIAKQHQLIGI